MSAIDLKRTFTALETMENFTQFEIIFGYLSACLMIFGLIGIPFLFINKNLSPAEKIIGGLFSITIALTYIIYFPGKTTSGLIGRMILPVIGAYALPSIIYVVVLKLKFITTFFLKR